MEILLLVAVGAELLWRGVSPLPRTAELPAGNEAAWLRALAVLWWLIGARVVVTVLALLKARDSRARQARLFSDLLAAAIYLTVVLIVLNSVLDLPVNGLLATSGVIAIVLGLALQNTLADVFSGIAVGLEQPFHVGDRVSLGDHVEGVVVQMNWRAIRIQTDGNDLATIPNSVAAKAQIINRSVPTARRAASVDITVASPFPPDVLIELLRQALLLCPGVLPDPAPSIDLNSPRAAQLHLFDWLCGAGHEGPRGNEEPIAAAGISFASPCRRCDRRAAIGCGAAARARPV